MYARVCMYTYAHMRKKISKILAILENLSYFCH